MMRVPSLRMRAVPRTPLLLRYHTNSSPRSPIQRLAVGLPCPPVRRPHRRGCHGRRGVGRNGRFRRGSVQAHHLDIDRLIRRQRISRLRRVYQAHDEVAVVTGRPQAARTRAAPGRSWGSDARWPDRCGWVAVRFQRFHGLCWGGVGWSGVSLVGRHVSAPHFRFSTWGGWLLTDPHGRFVVVGLSIRGVRQGRNEPMCPTIRRFAGRPSTTDSRVFAEPA